MMFRVVLTLTLLILGPCAGLAQGRTSFDGTWLVLFTCTTAPDGASGYTLRYLATVQDGVLHGENGVRGQAASIALDGTIQPDGSAMLLATGLAGDPTYNVGHARPLSPVSYHVQARFQRTSGTGKRVELRDCEAVFTRQ